MTSHIHGAELLLCGCRVNPGTGATYIRCARHACYAAMSFKELPEHALDPMPMPKHPHGLKPLCPECAGQRLLATADGVRCLECGHEFLPSDIVGFGLSVDSKPRPCPSCGTIGYGSCSCNQQQEVVR